ncbi:hypothetical protein MTO96_024692 [Rhipicephalus appendiculatus]
METRKPRTSNRPRTIAPRDRHPRRNRTSTGQLKLTPPRRRRVRSKLLKRTRQTNHYQFRTEVQNDTVATDLQQPLKSAGDKEGDVSELSEGEIRSESPTKQEDSANNSPRSNNIEEEEPEVFSTKKRRKGVKTKKKRRSPIRESTQTEDSGDESACSESSTYYQLVKKPKKKKSLKNRKKSLKKKTKVDSSRMSRK